MPQTGPTKPFDPTEDTKEEPKAVIEEAKAPAENPALIDITKLTREQLIQLRTLLNDIEETELPVGTSGISDSQAVGAERPVTEKALQMKDYLAKCPKAMFIIPRKEGEPINIVETVIMNGWRLNIRKGEFVDLPIPVIEILKASYSHTMNDNQPYLIANVGNKIDEITGEPKKASQLL